MTISAIIINILFIICLTSSVMPRALGLVTDEDKSYQKYLVPLLFGISQGVLAVIGYNLGRLISHLFVYIARYMVFAMMLVIAIKMFLDSMKMLKGKMLFTVNNNKEILLLTVLAAINTLLMSLFGPCFMPFGNWFFVAVLVAGFLWAFFTVRIPFKPEMIKKGSFVAFSASVFMLIIAILYMFTNLIA